MFLPLVQPLIPYQGWLIDLILSAVLLLQQRHPLRVRIPAAADDTVKVYAAGQKIQKRWHLAPLHNSTLVLAIESILRHT